MSEIMTVIGLEKENLEYLVLYGSIHFRTENNEGKNGLPF